ncbi:MAG TPA: type I pullulanase [Bacteroidales bacterium]|nr:MAG: type I pullulanase [Bacteroidetes bacterium GWE2_42_24]OFY26563.1 MAG: type I pullulanase [Bacteroidetes bacterium GWF2_43_11]HAQ66009.1 type I pullulanase [Bacteroidales bacterium]HBZ67442.1 type I pullulanase [Bacteroidales bacterium]
MNNSIRSILGSASLLLLLAACNNSTVVYNSLNEYPAYQGEDLELTYSSEASHFCLWSPGAEDAEVRLYKDQRDTTALSVLPMERSDSGTWRVMAKGDLKGIFYTFRIKYHGNWLTETPGIWAKAVGLNGLKACVIDLEETNPEGWLTDKAPAQKSYSDIILYELHVRDMSINPNSGIKHAGKFLGLAEQNTKNEEGLSTGLAHLKEMGITHVHLLPVFDFRSLDESKPDDGHYNWGYDPQNFNVPEGSYSTDPSDPMVRIREFKEMVLALHKNGIRVIMDVVYNHTGGPNELSNFNLTAPGYFYRMNADSTYSNGSGCGNETASDRPMLRHYITESVKYWAREYHVDGFRFDLMGIHDTETMNMVRRELDAIDPGIFVYGEGWLAGGSPLAEERRATKQNVPKMPRIAVFSDEFRDGVKGAWNDNKATAFASGRPGLEASVRFGIVGAVRHPGVEYSLVNYSREPWAMEPLQCINYVSCHDNQTLWDKFRFTCPDASGEELVRMNKLASAIVLTSQGVPFLHNGVEMLRTKQGVENSFESPDSINQIDWSWKSANKPIVDFHIGLIQLRKAHPAFRLSTAGEVVDRLRFLSSGDCTIAYVINCEGTGDVWKEVFVVFNGNRKAIDIDLPEGSWKVYLDGEKVINEGRHYSGKGKLKVPAISAMVLGRS